MFDAATFRRRRDHLRDLAKSGPVFLPGHLLVPRNYPDNVYPFRQNSHFLYYAGIARPELALVIGATAADDVLYGPPEHIDDVVWHGPHETLEEAAAGAGIDAVKDIAGLGAALRAAGDSLHYLAPYQPNVLLWVADLLERSPAATREGQSHELTRRIADQRAKKTTEEIAEIEEALAVTREMHVESMRVTRPGITEAEVAAAVQRVALSRDRAQSYNPIITVHGEVLHNNSYHHTLEAGQILLNDSGAESRAFYASDITRSYPVDGKFSPEQRDVYQVVLDAQLAGIAASRPGVTYKEVHLEASRVLAAGLVGMGLMKGDPEAAVAAGAHALFFPHGLGHMLGLDVHDMEDLGDVVGYPENTPRSEQFGLNYLRFAKPLEAGYVFTVEPGIYFVPALIDRWRETSTAAEFIDYDAVDRFRGFGGIRIEDDVLCTEDGSRVLGPAIPKTVDEVEATMAF